MQITFTEKDLQKGSAGHQALKALLNIMAGTEPEPMISVPKVRTAAALAEEPEEPKEPVQAETSAEDASQTESEKTYTLEEVRAALSEVAKKDGKELAKGLREAFGVSKVTDLDPANYAEMMRGIREVL